MGRVRQRSSGDNSPNTTIEELHLHLTSAGSATAVSGVHMPRPTAPLLGRTDELDLLRRTFSDGATRLRILVHGLAGMGRSSLALTFAWEVAHEYDLAVQVSCVVEDGAPPASAAEVAQRLLVRLEQVPFVPMHATQQLEALLSARRCLVLLTDVEDLAQVQGLNLPDSVDLITTSQSSWPVWLEAIAIPIGPLDPASATQLLETHAGPVDGAEVVARACLGHPGPIKVCAGVLRLGVYPTAESIAAAVRPGSEDWAEQMGTAIHHAMSRIAERLPVGSRALFSRLSRLPFPFLARDDVSVLVGGDGHLDNLVPLIEWHLVEFGDVDGLDVLLLSAFSRRALRDIGEPPNAQSVRDDIRHVSMGIVNRVSTAVDQLRRRSILEALATETPGGVSHVGNAEADLAREWQNFLSACGFLIFVDTSRSRVEHLPELLETLRGAAHWQERGGQARSMLTTVTLIAQASAELKSLFYSLSARYLAGVCLRDLGFPALACECFLSCIGEVQSEISAARDGDLTEAEQFEQVKSALPELSAIIMVGDQAIVELARAIVDLSDDEFWPLVHSSELLTSVSPDAEVVLPSLLAAFNLGQMVRRGPSHMTNASADVAVAEGLVQALWDGTLDNAVDLTGSAISRARQSSQEAHDIWGMLRLDVLERMSTPSSKADSAPLAASMSFGATTTAAEMALLISLALLRNGSGERKELDMLVAFVNAGSFGANLVLSDEAREGNAVLSLAIAKSTWLLTDMGSMRSARRLVQFIRWFASANEEERFTEFARRMEVAIQNNMVSGRDALDFVGLVMRGP